MAMINWLQTNYVEILFLLFINPILVYFVIHWLDYLLSIIWQRTLVCPYWSLAFRLSYFISFREIIVGGFFPVVNWYIQSRLYSAWCNLNFTTLLLISGGLLMGNRRYHLWIVDFIHSFGKRKSLRTHQIGTEADTIREVIGLTE